MRLEPSFNQAWKLKSSWNQSWNQTWTINQAWFKIEFISAELGLSSWTIDHVWLGSKINLNWAQNYDKKKIKLDLSVEAQNSEVIASNLSRSLPQMLIHRNLAETVGQTVAECLLSILKALTQDAVITTIWGLGNKVNLFPF